MIRKKIFLILSIFVFSCLLWPPLSQAQTPEAVIVIYPATEEREDSLALSVFFTVLDGSGRPIPRPTIESVNIELLGGDAEPVEASYENANTPFYIALLFDASGSMVNVMGSVREAAQSAMDNAPPTARFGVIQFNQEFTPIADFTNDHNRVKTAIERVESIPNAGTCLYDSVIDAIELLDDQIQTPQERRAIILFTDGKDEVLGPPPGPCSVHTYDDAIDRANPVNAPGTPVHTIGLCSDAGCENISRSQLRNMATDTSAFSAIGQQTDLGELFQEIMVGLSSQSVARANVCAKQGENQAALSVKLRGRDAPLSTTFNFSSSQNYECDTVIPPEVEITNIVYDEQKDIYQLSLSVISPELIYQIIIEVWDKKRGTQISQRTFENPKTTLQVEPDTEKFKADREYTFLVKAIDENESFIENEDGEITLDEKDVTHHIDEPLVEFTIESVTANYDTGQLNIDLNIARGEQQVSAYEGFIVDKTTGQRVHDFKRTLFESKRIQEILPQVMQQLEEARSYEVTIYLMTETKDFEGIYEFTVPPPPPCGVLCSIFKVLANPIILASIFIIIIFAILAIVFISWSQSGKGDDLAPPPVIPGVPPPVNRTQSVDPSTLAKTRISETLPPSVSPPQAEPRPAAASPVGLGGAIVSDTKRVDPDKTMFEDSVSNAQLIVVESPVLEQGQIFNLFEKAETSIGRNAGGQVNDIDLLDKSVSRKHAIIKFNGQDFVIYDAGATLKTRVNGEEVGKTEGIVLKDGAEIQLGPKTKLRFKQDDPSLTKMDDPNLTMLEEDDPNLTMLEEDDPNLTTYE